MKKGLLKKIGFPILGLIILVGLFTYVPQLNQLTSYLTGSVSGGYTFGLLPGDMPAGQTVSPGQSNVMVANYNLTSRNQIVHVDTLVFYYEGSTPVETALSHAELLTPNSAIISSKMEGKYVTFSAESKANPLLILAPGQKMNLTLRVNIADTALTGSPFRFNVRGVMAYDDAGEKLNGLVDSSKLWSNTFKVKEPVTAGTLTIHEKNSPEISIVMPGSKEVAAWYEFSATGEAFNVNRVTVVNDFSGQFNAPENTVALKNVTLYYPGLDGTMHTATQTLMNGTATFSGLSPAMYVPKDGTAMLRILPEVWDVDYGQTLAAAQFRVGLLEVNTGSPGATFEAIGDSSGIGVYTPTITGSDNISKHIVRFTKPTVSLNGPSHSPLTSSNTDLYTVNIKADPARGLEVKRLTFYVDAQLGSGDSLNDFSIFEGGNKLSDEEVAITSAVKGTSSIGTLFPLNGEMGIIHNFADLDNNGDGKYSGEVSVSFNTARTIAAGSGKIFTLKASVTGASNVGESITAYVPGDTQLVTDIAANLAGYTNHVIDNHFIWSDKSYMNPAHSENTPDWTNGYLVNTFPTASRVLDY